jgi:phosphoglycerol transferase MdoB-like AlkP superfamily enzyme
LRFPGRAINLLLPLAPTEEYMTKFLIDALGWIGALSLIVAYASVSFRKMAADGALYQLMNAVGSFLLIVNTVYYRAYPSAFVNVVWITIAVAARLRVKRYQYAKHEN